MTKFIVQVDKDGARSLDFDESVGNPIWIGSWIEDKPEVQKLTRVTKSMIDACVDQIMDTVTEGGHGETQLMMYRDEIRRVIKAMLFE